MAELVPLFSSQQPCKVVNAKQEGLIQDYPGTTFIYKVDFGMAASVCHFLFGMRNSSSLSNIMKDVGMQL